MYLIFALFLLLGAVNAQAPYIATCTGCPIGDCSIGGYDVDMSSRYGSAYQSISDALYDAETQFIPLESHETPNPGEGSIVWFWQNGKPHYWYVWYQQGNYGCTTCDAVGPFLSDYLKTSSHGGLGYILCQPFQISYADLGATHYQCISATSSTAPYNFMIGADSMATCAGFVAGATSTGYDNAPPLKVFYFGAVSDSPASLFSPLYCFANIATTGPIALTQCSTTTTETQTSSSLSLLRVVAFTEPILFFAKLTSASSGSLLYTVPVTSASTHYTLSACRTSSGVVQNADQLVFYLQFPDTAQPLYGQWAVSQTSSGYTASGSITGIATACFGQGGGSVCPVSVGQTLSYGAGWDHSNSGSGLVYTWSLGVINPLVFVFTVTTGYCPTTTTTSNK